MEKPIPLVIDTDIGDNIDDSLALAIACRAPEVDLRAITTVHGDTIKRAELARGILSLGGAQKVPVAPGCERPLIAPVERQTPLLYDVHPKRPLQRDDLNRDAVEVLLRLSRQHGRVSLLTIGPLTNVAVALRLHPELEQTLEITAMAGAFHLDRAETNVRLDPEAAQIVFASRAPVRVIPLDVTIECPLAMWVPEALAASRDELKRSLGRACRIWQERTGRDIVLPHDPIALVAAIYPELFVFEPMRIEVALHPDDRRGRLLAVPRPDSNVHVATRADLDQISSYILERLAVTEQRRGNSRCPPAQS